jgi:hypothetical protein
VSHGQVAAPAYSSDGPAVAVSDPIVGREAESAVVATGDDQIANTGQVPIGQAHLAADRVVITAKEMITSLSVEFSDQRAGRREHDRIEAGGPVGHPGREGILGGGGEVADVNPAVIKVEVECLWFAFAEGE